MQPKENESISCLSLKQVKELFSQNKMHDIYFLNEKQISLIYLVGYIHNVNTIDPKKHNLQVSDGCSSLTIQLHSPKLQDYQLGCYYWFACQIKQFKDSRFLSCSYCDQILDTNQITRQIVKIIHQAASRKKCIPKQLRQPFGETQQRLTHQEQLNPIQSQIMATIKLYESVPLNILKAEFKNKFSEEDLIRSLAELKEKKLIAKGPDNGNGLTFILF